MRKGSRCPAHERAGFLEQDERARYDRQRGTAAQRGYDAAWRRLRDGVLREEPLCRACEGEGRVAVATLVDHIEPIWKAPRLRLVRSNLQPLCDAHHAAKTRQDGSYG
ncbi:HNH endonuclease [Vulgatibacter sp.]|uniref:HNH endonuclease n=1 Tax=Vulgatibacter sp. TaxID=1971226 RepID=UPI003563EABC